MNELELRQRIAKGENFHTEFKKQIVDNNDLVKYIVSFANTDGGELIIDVSDDFSIIGIDDIDEIMRKVDSIAFDRCEPPVTVVQETVSIEEKTVLIVHIPKGAQRPYRTKSGQFYIRSSNRCRQASREELLRIFQAAQSVFYDELSLYTATQADLHLDFFLEFVRMYLNIDIRIDETKRILKNFHLITEKNIPTVTGMVFFGRDPQRYLPQCRIVCLFIRGDDLSVPPSDRKDVRGRIPEMIEFVQRFLNLYLVEEHIIKGFEPETMYEIPEIALREAVINAIAHRDYTIMAPIRIIVYINRVEIRTPGKLPNSVTIESMKVGGSHVLRNPTVYNLLSKMKMVTDSGSGVIRMIRSVKEHSDKDILFKETDGEFIVTLPRKSG
ncbi:MAG: transcriptional regulator [Candidatus Omnitrophota bacterium]|nr:MAG: transcriptional regulator [Candidatus Omnitrophota bacterium]